MMCRIGIAPKIFAPLFAGWQTTLVAVKMQLGSKVSDSKGRAYGYPEFFEPKLHQVRLTLTRENVA